MPPKTRGSNKTLKTFKENVGASIKGKNKSSDKLKKPQRKALADKTNSASDDNANLSTNKQQVMTSESNDLKRSRRERKIPKRYIGNSMLINSSKRNSVQDLPTPSPIKSQAKKILTKKKTATKTSLKTTSKALENSILKSRPKRVCKLPSKLEGHSISPNKFIPLQPINASTPVAIKTIKHTAAILSDYSLADTPSPVPKDVKHLKQKVTNKKIKTTSDSNNNGKMQQQIDKCFEKQTLSCKFKKKPLESFRVFDDIKNSLKRNSSKTDPYEFTFDPSEEPPPQKKKKKRLVKTRQPKPKTAVKSTYEKNLAKALATLKKVVATNAQLNKDVQVTTSKPPNKNINDQGKSLKEVSEKNYAVTDTLINEGSNNIPSAVNYNSVRIEDIALDLQEPDHTIDYSPVNSPHHTPKTTTEEGQVIDKDPLNLRDDISFFDDQPVASSSMNTSIRHPLASPWRVEFGSLPIKWPVNTYVKPNMTPAVESSFINFQDIKKKHVYTNIVPVDDQPPPQETSLKQTSIFSFIKEVAERSIKKKMKSTPIKANSIFEDVTNTSINVSPSKSISKNNSTDVSKSSNSNHVGEDMENSILKTPEKEKSSKRGTFFGFDDTGDENQENISPVKKDKRRELRPRSRVVLQDINNVKGLSRAPIPISMKSKPVLNSDNLNNDFEDPKTAFEPPVFPDKEKIQANVETTNVTLDDDSQSVHLFEDLDLIHHYHQPPRKSYGKPKKMVFQNNSDTDSDVTNNKEQDSDEEENLDDLSFKLPSVKPKRTKIKKMTKKEKMCKKEEQEAENWAAGFNSMCEDIEGFDLIVE